MCKVGDIIVITDCIAENGEKIGKHSFIVIDDTPDLIKGLPYEFLVLKVLNKKKQN